jgi:anaerobic magnesium-protoporphyrin IX monomethyl ester cyclase
LKALLVQSPATSPWLAHREWEPPSISLATIAGQVDNHDIKIADAVRWRKRARHNFLRTLDEVRPDVVGFSSMTFQYDSTLRFAYLVKQFDPKIRTVLGGYHASLFYRELAEGPDAQYWDAIFRGEGDHSFGEYLDALEDHGRGLDQILGLSYKEDGEFFHNGPRPLADLSQLRIPDRSKRIVGGFHMYFRRADVIETSRGCLHACKFCSIRQMYGKAYREFPLDRVAADVEDAYRRGARHIFIVDDNITMDMDRFEALCDTIIALKLRNLKFTTQASPIGFAKRPDVARKMVQAGIVSIFLGIENISTKNLRAMRKPNTVEFIRKGIRAVQEAGGIPIAGIINGLRHDDLESMRENYAFMKSMGITGVMDQIMTPYPCTQLREEMLTEGSVANNSDFRWYDGYFSNVRTDSFDSAGLQYARWRVRREIIGMWRPTRADWRHFKDFTVMWQFAMRHLVWLNERTLETLFGLEGRYKLQMQKFMQLNDFGIEIPGRDRTGTYNPLFGDSTDPFYQTRLELLRTEIQSAAAARFRAEDAKQNGPARALKRRVAQLVQRAVDPQRHAAKL